MKCKSQIIIATVFIPILVISTLYAQIVYGQATSNVNATIKISVCGNNIAEGGEDCDNTDLRGKTCKNLGYGGGTLSCDISCSYDLTACTAITPTPTRTVTLIPTQSIISTTSRTTSTFSPQVISTPTPILISQPTSVLPSVTQNTLPPTIRNFDLNGNGRIDMSELRPALGMWVMEWKQFLKVGSQGRNQPCDINQNGTCGLHDFSILLFYVGK